MTASGFTRKHGVHTEPRGFNLAQDELLALTRKRYYAALATSTPDGLPGVATLRYAVTDEFELVMGTLRTSRKYGNQQRNANVGVVIWDDDFSIQVEGTFDEPTGADQERLRRCFAEEFPKEARLRAGRPSHVYFRITPTWARFRDLSDEPPRLLTLDFETETESRGTWTAR